MEIPATRSGTSATTIMIAASRRIVLSRQPLSQPRITPRQHHRHHRRVQPPLHHRLRQRRCQRLPGLSAPTSSIVHHQLRHSARSVRSSTSSARLKYTHRYLALLSGMNRRHGRNKNLRNAKSVRNARTTATTSSLQAIPCCNMQAGGWTNLAEYGAEYAIISASET